MENKKISGAAFAQSALGKFFLGGLPSMGGILTMLVSLGVLPYMDLHPSRIAIFNDPHTWEVFAVGTVMLSFGIANILPPHMKALGKLNMFVLLLSFLAVVIRILLKKLSL